MAAAEQKKYTCGDNYLRAVEEKKYPRAAQEKKNQIAGRDEKIPGKLLCT